MHLFCSLVVAVAHVKGGAVTGLEARLALQKGREEAQRLSKLAQHCLQQQQQQRSTVRSSSFPPNGAPAPIGPPSKAPQVCATLVHELVHAACQPVAAAYGPCGSFTFISSFIHS